ncbi:MAG: hypothetical protein ABR575_10160 [Actinomycetota bacterium]
MRRLMVASAALCVVLVPGAPAGAAEVAAAPGSFAAGSFAPPVVVIAEGEGIRFTNGDLPRHNLTAADAFLSKKAARKSQWCSAFDPGRCPLFLSPTITTGQSADVRGLQRVRSGSEYGFLCTIHPNMTGTLVVR